MKRLLIILTLFVAPLQAKPQFNLDSKFAGKALVKGIQAGFALACLYKLNQIYREVSATSEFRKAVATRGFSDLLHADLTKLATPNTIKLVAGGIASATVAYVLYQEIRKQLFEEQELETTT